MELDYSNKLCSIIILANTFVIDKDKGSSIGQNELSWSVDCFNERVTII